MPRMRIRSTVRPKYTCVYKYISGWITPGADKETTTLRRSQVHTLALFPNESLGRRTHRQAS
jgi:hypothetical protein